MKDRQIEENSSFSIHQCPVCNGFGTLSYGKKPCHACEGRGFIVIDEENGLPVIEDREKDDKKKRKID